MNINIRRFGFGIICAVALLLCLMSGMVASAQAENGDIRIVCTENDKALPDIHWSLYRVGGRTNEGSFALEGNFADYPVVLNDLSASEAQAAADTLENYAAVDGIVPSADGYTDENGNLTFSGLNVGVYLVSGTKLEYNDSIYTPAASLVEFTGSDLTVYPKFEITDIPKEEEIEYIVRKLWANDDSQSEVRPDSITVEIYLGDELYETVQLSKDNGWSYSWTAQTGGEWHVVETDVPKNYTVTYRDNGTEFAVVNTYNAPDVSVPDNSTPTDGNTTSNNKNRLPQTGLLWWPVPVLAASGLIFIAVGSRVGKKRK